MPDTVRPEPSKHESFAEFYPFYLGEHSNRISRRLHFFGLSLALVCAALLVATGSPIWLLFAVLSGYGFAWIGHFFFEKNNPASFRQPLYSLMGDWKMYWEMVTGRIPF